MTEDFIISKLNEIGRAIERKDLRYVLVSSFIDESFGRTYVRWKVDVEVDGHESHYYKDYIAYQLWDKDQSFFKDNAYARNHFISTMAKYYSDVKRFIELTSIYYPDVTIYNDVCEFEIMHRKLFISDARNISIILKDKNFDSDEVVGQYVKIKDRFTETTIKNIVNIEFEATDENRWIIQEKEGRKEDLVEFNDYPIRMKEYYNKNTDKFNFRTDFIDNY